MIKTITSLAIAAALVGCAASSETTTERKTLTRYSGMTIAKPVAAVAQPEAQVRTVVISGQVDDERLGTIYFDFDQYLVKAQYLSLLQDLAGELQRNPDRKLVLEGHTDEDGSREYNVSLGQRRSEAVRQILVRLGVSPSQLEAVSYGEEKPAGEGGSPDAKGKNRRAEIRAIG